MLTHYKCELKPILILSTGTRTNNAINATFSCATLSADGAIQVQNKANSCYGTLFVLNFYYSY